MRTLYIAPDCHECDEILAFVEENNVKISIEKLKTQEERIEKGILVFPALYENNEPVAFGSDILSILA